MRDARFFPMFGGALLAMALLSAPALAADADGGLVDRLTEALVEAVPLGTIMQGLAAADPAWPVQDKPDAVGAGELACLRDELTTDGQRRAMRREVARYVAADPERAAGDLALLERGASRVLGALMLAGADAERTGVPSDEAAVLGRFAAAETEAMMALLVDAERAPLRGLAGLGNVFLPQRSADENAAQGEKAGVDLATRFMLAALDACGVPPERLR